MIGMIVITSGWFESKVESNHLKYFYYGIIFFTGIIRAFAGPTSNAILAQLVPKNLLPYAANISSSTWLVASILGHATAGFLIAGIGVHQTFFVILTLCLAACAMIYFIPKLPKLNAKQNEKAWKSVVEGL
jgi:MFS family permease